MFDPTELTTDQTMYDSTQAEPAVTYVAPIPAAEQTQEVLEVQAVETIVETPHVALEHTTGGGPATARKEYNDQISLCNSSEGTSLELLEGGALCAVDGFDLHHRPSCVALQTLEDFLADLNLNPKSSKTQKPAEVPQIDYVDHHAHVPVQRHCHVDEVQHEDEVQHAKHGFVESLREANLPYRASLIACVRDVIDNLDEYGKFMERRPKTELEVATSNASQFVWTDAEAPPSVYEAVQKELEDIANPIFAKAYEAHDARSRKNKKKKKHRVKLDPNGILNDSALDNGFGKPNNITAANAKPSLTQADLDYMAPEAEQFHFEVENKQHIEAKSGFKNYCMLIRAILREGRLKKKLKGGDEEKIEMAVRDSLDWLGRDPLGDKSDFEAKLKELEGIVVPIMMKAGVIDFYNAMTSDGLECRKYNTTYKVSQLLWE